MAGTTNPERPGHALTLERLFEDPPLAGTTPNRFAFSGDGAALAWLAGSSDDSEVLDLWVAALPHGAPKVLVRTADVADVASIEVSEAERAVQERLRLHQGGITSFAWCGADAAQIVFPLSGELYCVQVATGAVDRVTSEKAVRLDIRSSPRGSFLSFARDGELCVLDMASRNVRKLTNDASESVSSGVAEFVAQEEMDRLQGYFWSSDEEWVAFLRVDESPVSVKVRPRIHADRTELHEQRYPAAGEANAVVELRVARPDGSVVTAVPLPSEDGYVARVSWSRDRPKLWVQWQSRDQRRVVLLEADAPSFEPRVVITEADDAWVALTDDLHPLAGGDAFLWTSERSGIRQIERYERVAGGWEPRAVTASAEPVVRVLGVDRSEQRVFFVRATELGKEQHVFSKSLSGGTEQRLTGEAGWHEPVFCPTGPQLVDIFATFERPPIVQVRDDTGAVTCDVDTNPAQELLGLEASEPEWVQLEASDGTLLNAVWLPPLGRAQGRKAPALVHVYAGPGAQMVARRFLRFRPFHLLLNQQGFGVFMIDGRGTPNRDRAFSRAIHLRLGDIEIEDQGLGAKWLQARPEVDPERIGIWGWSYGGYASLLALLRPGSPFAAAAAVAPVTDWRLYDTHYTERYLGTPEGNPEAYRRADVLSQVGSLSKPLLIMHGMADDNVLFEHSLRLIELLQQKGIVFELMAYPGRAHALDGRRTQLHVFRTLLSFFERRLGRPGCD